MFGSPFTKVCSWTHSAAFWFRASSWWTVLPLKQIIPVVVNGLFVKPHNRPCLICCLCYVQVEPIVKVLHQGNRKHLSLVARKGHHQVITDSCGEKWSPVGLLWGSSSDLYTKSGSSVGASVELRVILAAWAFCCLLRFHGPGGEVSGRREGWRGCKGKNRGWRGGRSRRRKVISCQLNRKLTPSSHETCDAVLDDVMSYYGNCANTALWFNQIFPDKSEN